VAVYTMTKLSSTGAPGSSPFNAPSNAIPTADAVDGLGNVWVTEVANNTILKLNSSGAYLSGAVGFQNGETAVPEAIAVDGSGNVWYSTFNDATIHELVGAAAPVVTPLAYGVKNSLLGTRP
jgi:streptogramin lyase